MRGPWIAVAIACAACHAPAAPPRTIRFESTVHSERLPNGLRVLVLEDRGTNLVEVGIRVAAGAAADPEGKTGLAHLVEHLMFEVRHQDRPIAAELSALAIGFNAFTSWEATHYVTTARADQLDRVLALEARRFASTCDDILPGTFEREREVVRNELRLRTSAPLEGWRDLLDAIYPAGHPYRRPIGGTDVDLASIELGDVCGYLAGRYTPDRMVVVVSGDVRPRAAIAMLERSFGALPVRRAAAQPAFPPLRPARLEIETDLPLAAGSTLVAWAMPPRYSARHILAKVALALIEDRVPGAFATITGSTEQPIALFVLRHGDPQEELAKLDDAIAKVPDTVWDQELESTINRHARRLLTEYDDLDARVYRLAESYQAGEGDHIFVFQLRLLHGATRDALEEVAREVFRGPRVVITTRPSKRTARREGSAPLSYAGRSHDDAWTAPVDRAEATRSLEVPIGASRIERAIEYTHESGMRVILLQTPAVPLLEARLVFAGGTADDPPGKSGLARAVASALDFEPISPYSGSTPAYVAMRMFGDSLDRDVGTDHTVFEVRGLASHLDALIASLASLVVDGEYPSKKLRHYVHDPSKRSRSRSPQSKLLRWIEVRARFERALGRAIFGAGHPYARDSRDRGITADDIESLRRRRFTGRNAVLIVTGQFDVELLRDHIDHWFGDLPSGEPTRRSRPPAAPERPPGGVVAVETEADEATTTVRIHFGTPRDPRRRAARLVIARILDERAGRIRSQLGAAYVVHAYHAGYLGPSMFGIEAEVDSARAEESLRALLAELELVRAGGPEIEEAFVRARREILHRVLAESSGAARAGDHIASLVAGDLPLTFQADLARQITRLTIADVMPIITSELARDRAVIGLLGPPASVAAARRALQP